MTTPSESALAAVLANAALTAYAEHERIRCNVGMGGPLSQCGCVCGEVLPECRLSVHAEHRRLHVAAALLAATDARTEADGLEGVESVLRERMNEVMISAQGSLAEDRCEVLHPDEYDGTGACVECSEHAADLLHDGWDERIVAPVLARIAHLEAALAAAEATALLKVADEWRDRWVKDGKHHGIPGCYSPGYERNLRERATLTTTQPAPTEPPC